MTWPYEKKTPDTENWDNGNGLTFNADYTRILWSTTNTDPQQIEVWDNETRLHQQTEVLDGDPLDPSLPLTFGLYMDGSVFGCAPITGQRNLCEWDTYGSAVVSGHGAVTIAGGDARSFKFSDDTEVVALDAYSTQAYGRLWDGSTLTLLDTTAGTPNLQAQIKGFILDENDKLWALCVNLDLGANTLGFWNIADPDGYVDGEWHTVTVSGTQGSTNGQAYGFYSNGAFIVDVGHGAGQRICRIDATTWTETHATAAYAANVNNVYDLQWAPLNAETFYVCASQIFKVSAADLSVVAAYPFTNWGFDATEIVGAVRDPLNEAIFVNFTDGDIGWLFFPEIRRVHGHIRYGAER